MGVYDFFKGKCPKCPSFIDLHPEYGQCGDIQTKYFIRYDEPNEQCFRSFQPGSYVPFIPESNFLIGRTCCCNTLIKACFQDNRLVEYTVAIGKEKFDYVQREMNSRFESKYVPLEDQLWFHHYSSFRKFQQTFDFKTFIIQQAFHPKRIQHYLLDKGYTIDELCV